MTETLRSRERWAMWVGVSSLSSKTHSNAAAARTPVACIRGVLAPAITITSNTRISSEGVVVRVRTVMDLLAAYDSDDDEGSTTSSEGHGGALTAAADEDVAPAPPSKRARTAAAAAAADNDSRCACTLCSCPPSLAGRTRSTHTLCCRAPPPFTHSLPPQQATRQSGSRLAPVSCSPVEWRQPAWHHHHHHHAMPGAGRSVHHWSAAWFRPVWWWPAHPLEAGRCSSSSSRSSQGSSTRRRSRLVSSCCCLAVPAAASAAAAGAHLPTRGRQLPYSGLHCRCV